MGKATMKVDEDGVVEGNAKLTVIVSIEPDNINDFKIGWEQYAQSLIEHAAIMRATLELPAAPRRTEELETW